MAVLPRPRTSVDPVQVALRANGRALVSVAIFSAIINLLLLVSPIFMLQVYDRVLTSRSQQTLVALLGVTALLLVLMALLDQFRASILIRIGLALDRSLREHVFNGVIGQHLLRRTSGDGQQPIRDLDVVRTFLGGPGPIALFDLPWMPLYVAICFLLHPLLGSLALAGAAILIGLTVWGYYVSKEPIRQATDHASRRNAWIEGGRRNAETLRALGMLSAIRSRWMEAHLSTLMAQMRGADAAGRIAAFTKGFRILLQSVLLAAGAYLVIEQVATPGVMLAASVIAARALQPIEQVVGQWRPFLQYRDARARLANLAVEPEAMRTSLPPPNREVSLVNVAIAPHGARAPTLAGVNFRLKAGQAAAVIGPSGAGKSTLARGLVGVWPIVRGELRLDGATQDQWHPDDLGKLVGYLPQSVELFDGTVADNIARFSPDREDAAVVAAAQMAGATQMILKLPEGFDTTISDTAVALSAGQRQRVGLARALYNDPFLVVLDEPNSNLDAEGEVALGKAIRAVRQRGGIVVVMAHRPSALAEVDQVLFVRDGMQSMFGARDEILKRAVVNPEIAGRSGGITAGTRA
ncbi:type I secretion system permease/ATPase [Bradyrhizobium sp. LHD-71]|uniref:type I secretion system permease/ATPase n=1 Tax=Bradyrhizobium sp. LHD-71 TaxID=3072141 RepID=UPI00280D7D91|nr:type I secretion system permease/ATPase [Bradyrhizobium sp. LHD-71]MDQ8732124.1 type I secretion system permease/ATPase [Bradyrhizobium sp. LHD-71]